MKYGKKVREVLLKEEFVLARTRVELTPGKALKIYRELQGLTQPQLAKLAGLTQATISSLEHDRVTMGLERVKALARALRVHPAVLAFPSWDVEKESAA